MATSSALGRVVAGPRAELLSGDFCPRITPRPSDADEIALRSCAQKGRRRAAERVGEVIVGLDLEGMRQKVNTTTAQQLRVPAGSLGRLCDEPGLDRMLMGMHCTTGHMRLADGTHRAEIPGADTMVRPARGVADPARIVPFAMVEGMQRGITLVVNNLTPRVGGELGRLTHDLTRSTGTPVGVNAYISERGARGFGQHWDDHDVIIIQCRGAKKWALHQPRELAPIKQFVPDSDAGEVVFTTVLEPGDALYIPRGWSHSVGGFPDELSVHYTISIRPPYPLDMLGALASTSATPRSTPSLAPAPLPVFERATFERWIAAERARLFADPGTGLLEASGILSHDLEGAWFSAPLPGGAVFVDGAAMTPEEIGLAASGNVLAFSRTAVPLLGALLSGEQINVETSAAEFNMERTDLVSLVRLLATLDIVHVAGHDDA